ncbi:hypothetical protein M9458_041381, partial [Cirrhinus mrigala]
QPFRMLMLKQILSQVRPGDWFCLLDLKHAYFPIQIAPHHRRFLRSAFEGVAYQYTFLPFGISLARRTFTKCMDAALSPLRQKGIRILNYLNNWLNLAQSEDELLSHRSFLLSHLDCMGLRINFAKSALSPSQQILFLGTVLDLTLMRALVMPEHALAIQQLTASFKVGAPRPLKAFQKMLGLMGLLRMRPFQHWLKPRVPSLAWCHGCLQVKVDQACVAALAPWRVSARSASLFLPNLFLEVQGCVGPRVAQPPPLCFSPSHPDPTGHQASQGSETQGAVSGPLLREPTLVRRTISAALSSNVAHPPETGPPLSGKQNNMAPSARVVGSTPVASRWEPANSTSLHAHGTGRCHSTCHCYMRVVLHVTVKCAWHWTQHGHAHMAFDTSPLHAHT